MALYLRYTENIEKDVERGVSYHYTGLDKDTTAEEVANACNIDIDEVEYNGEARQWVQVLPGLCAFELDADNLEDAVKEAKDFYNSSVYNTRDMGPYAIVEGDYVGDCPEGDCISVTKILYESGK